MPYVLKTTGILGVGQAGWIYLLILRVVSDGAPGCCIGPEPPRGGFWNNGQSHVKQAAQSWVPQELAGTTVWDPSPDLLYQDLFFLEGPW